MSVLNDAELHNVINNDVEPVVRARGARTRVRPFPRRSIDLVQAAGVGPRRWTRVRPRTDPRTGKKYNPSGAEGGRPPSGRTGGEGQLERLIRLGG